MPATPVRPAQSATLAWIEAARRISLDRLRSDLERLFALGREPGSEGAMRLALSPADLRGRDFVIGLMRQAGLEARVDAAGSVIGVLPGAGSFPGALIIGSHIDTVPGGGMFDGALGVLGGIEVVRALGAAGCRLLHDLEVVAFCNEEKARFPAPFGGSAAMTQGLTPADLSSVHDADGVPLAEAMRRAGLDSDAVVGALRPPGFCRGYLELHVEQGGRLDREEIPIGVVSAIVGIVRLRLRLTGRANHAGTTPMSERRDALWGAAELISGVRRAALAEHGEMVGTVGFLRVAPNVANVVPAEVEMVVELRAADEARLARAQGELAAFAAEVATAHRLGLEQRAVRPGSAVPMDSGVQDEIEAASAELGLRTRRLVSWAGHDASSFAPLAPTGMIFVPSQGGVSHAPDERTAWADAEAGVRVLALTACRLDARLAARAAARGGKAGS